ncbi:MAG: hypothetical protein PUE90_05460 [Bacteroidales bacterium]|nr:hypothetical protein [Bacteroidales bacterium]
MKISLKDPKVALLRERVEARYGHKLLTHGDFASLSETLRNDHNIFLSDSTLERVWGYSSRASHENAATTTLDLLAQYIGSKDWHNFLSECERDSDMFNPNIIATADLVAGMRIQLEWKPDRVCVVEYLGNNRFRAVSSLNATIQPGDTFECLSFEPGRELIMDRFCRANETDSQARYVVGSRHGLTSAKSLVHKES